MYNNSMIPLFVINELAKWIISNRLMYKYAKVQCSNSNQLILLIIFNEAIYL
jgi:hypothetical protein